MKSVIYIVVAMLSANVLAGYCLRDAQLAPIQKTVAERDAQLAPIQKKVAEMDDKELADEIFAAAQQNDVARMKEVHKHLKARPMQDIEEITAGAMVQIVNRPTPAHALFVTTDADIAMLIFKMLGAQRRCVEQATGMKCKKHLTQFKERFDAFGLAF